MSKEVDCYMKKINELIDFLQGEEFIYIQAHNFPDHDAVASAFALQNLFIHYGIESHLVYDGEIQRDSLKQFILDAGIQIKHINDYHNELRMEEKHKIVIIDGCKGNKNVTDLIGDEVGVIDHHHVVSPEDVEYFDIRTEYGACATIIASYFNELRVEISENIATAIMIGINMDTAHFTRCVNEADLNAYFHCYGRADIQYVNYMLRNYIRIDDLQYYKYMIDNVIHHDRMSFCYFPDGCSQNLLGIISDFVLALEEIDFVVLCAKNENRVNFSLRSEAPEWDASVVVRRLLEGIGFGGGHMDMAGGVINVASLFDKKKILNNIISLLDQFCTKK